MLNTAILVFDEVQRGEFQRLTELRLWLDTLGISPKGQQDRRWQPPAEPKTPANSAGRKGKPDAYKHLRVVE